MNKVPTLLIIRGTPGSGKSTYAEKLAQMKSGTLHLENDMYLMHDGKYVWTPTAAKEASRQCFDDTVAALKDGHDVIVSNVFVTRSSVLRYVNAAKEIGAKVKVLRMAHDYGNVHSVPPNVLDSMKAGFQDFYGEEIR